jgi:hypothetical protein
VIRFLTVVSIAFLLSACASSPTADNSGGATVASKAPVTCGEAYPCMREAASKPADGKSCGK